MFQWHGLGLWLYDAMVTLLYKQDNIELYFVSRVIGSDRLQVKSYFYTRASSFYLQI